MSSLIWKLLLKENPETVSHKPSVMTITQLGNPVLRKTLKAIPKPSSAVVKKLAIDMILTMKKAQGVGIAANQVGVDQRIFIVAPEPSVRYPHAPRQPPIAMINPAIVSKSKKMQTDWEGCLSIPGIRGRVPRHYELAIEFTGLDGQRYQGKLKGFIARIFQHELDHINGMVYLDRVVDTRTLMTEIEYRRALTLHPLPRARGRGRAGRDGRRG